MTPQPAWVRRVFLTFAVTIGFGLVVVVFAFFKMTAEIDVGPIKEPNSLDAREADRKIGIYKKALEGSEHGFVRLSEVEVNSYLHQHYFGDQRQKTNASVAATRLLDARLKFNGQDFFWYSWVKGKWFGRPIEMIWRREIEFKRGMSNWLFQTKAMSLGNLNVPARCWETVNKQLGEADEIFGEERQWLDRVPVMEIKTNNLTSSPELRLFTYSVPTTTNESKP